MNENPVLFEVLREVVERLARVESRLCKLMIHMGVDPLSTKPTKTTFVDLLKQGEKNHEFEHHKQDH